MTINDLISRIELTEFMNAEIAFLKTPTYPALIYFIDPSGEGSDDENLINSHKIRLELYQLKIDKAVEEKIQNEVLYDVEYDSDSGYINEEKLFYRYYYFSISEII